MKTRKIKRMVSAFMALALSSSMLGCLPTSAEGTTVSTIKGDLNLDGRVTIADVILINKYMAGMVKLNENQLANGDCYDDSTGTVNNIDGLAIMKLIGGKIESLPIVRQSSYNVPFTYQIISDYNSVYDQKATLINTYEEYQEFIKQTDAAAIKKYAEEGLPTDSSQITYPKYDESFFNTKSVVIQKTTFNTGSNTIVVDSANVTNGTLNTVVNYGVPYPNSCDCAMVGYIIAVEMDKEYAPQSIADFKLEKVRFWDEEYLKTAPITVYDPMNDPNFGGKIEDGLEYVYTDTTSVPGQSIDVYLPNKRADLVTVTFTDTGDVYTLKEVMQKGWVTASKIAQMAPNTLKFCWVDPLTNKWVNIGDSEYIVYDPQSLSNYTGTVEKNPELWLDNPYDGDLSVVKMTNRLNDVRIVFSDTGNEFTISEVVAQKLMTQSELYTALKNVIPNIVFVTAE